MKPTAEQEQALALFQTGQALAIEAGAGTGKTTTLKLLAESTRRRGQYVAFNKAIVVEAGAKMPSTVACRTAHSLAFRAVGVKYKSRLEAPRIRPVDIANRLHLDAVTVMVDGKPKTLAGGFLASRAMEAITRFCQSADDAPSGRHVPYLDGIDPMVLGKRTYANNNLVREHLEPHLEALWADIQRTEGWVPFKHDHYLKLWQLRDPYIEADFILFDEAQDANPVLLAAIAAQKHCQLVFVGDSNQQIYEFTGAINALANVPVEHRTFLTQSFRFGPAIADVANGILETLQADLRLTGCDIPSRLATSMLSRPAAILTRTNAEAVRRLLDYQRSGIDAFLVGGAADVVAFCEAADRLQHGQPASHPELACFDSWLEVKNFIAEGDGADLELMVRLIDEHGARPIITALTRMSREDEAEAVISTAHKAKGREWASVQLAPDFSAKNGSDREGDAERRLLYVAVTRAREVLDVLGVRSLAERHGLIQPLPPQGIPELAPPVQAVQRPAAGRVSLIETCPTCGSDLGDGLMAEFRARKAPDDRRTCPDCPARLAPRHRTEALSA